MMTTKAQALSLSTVVIGVILLVVLAVVVFIFFRGTNSFDSGVQACDRCVTSASFCGQSPYEDYKIAVPMRCTPSEEVSGNQQTYCCKSSFVG